MKKIIVWLRTYLLPLVIILNITGCYQSEIFLFGGSTSMIALMQSLLLGEDFNKIPFVGFNETANVKIAYNANGSAAGEIGVKNRTLVMGFTSREISAEYINSSKYKVFNFAIDGMLIVTKLTANCKIENLTTDKISILSQVYAGKEHKWSDLLGPNCSNTNKIIAINRELGSGTRDTWKNFLKIDNFHSELRIVNSTWGMINQIKSTNNAIGYVSFANLDSIIDNGLNALKIDNIAPSLETLTDGTYSLARLFYAIFYNDMRYKKLINDFISFIKNEQSHLIFAKMGLVFKFDYKN